MKVIWVAIWAAILAASIAHNCGVPWWRDWEPGDAVDIGLATWVISWHLLNSLEEIIMSMSKEPSA
jgi:hypothetical protein